MLKNFFYPYLIFFFLLLSSSLAETINSINIKGNERVSSETIKMFSDIEVGSEFTPNKSNLILKNLYESNFFSNVSINFNNNQLSITVKEYPIIQNIFYEGIKANKIKEKVFANLSLKPRSSYNEIFLKEDKKIIENSLKNLGYYFSQVKISIVELDDNNVPAVIPAIE